MALASLFLPFLPLLPLQILLNNLIYDVSEFGIPFDNADPEDLARPRHWNIRSILRFTLIMGPLSSIFDLATFLLLRLGFDAGVESFRTAWFVESIITQTLVIFIIRTSRPIWSSRPHPALIASSLAALGAAFVVILSPLGRPFGFTWLPLGLARRHRGTGGRLSGERRGRQAFRRAASVPLIYIKGVAPRHITAQTIWIERSRPMREVHLAVRAAALIVLPGGFRPAPDL